MKPELGTKAMEWQVGDWVVFDLKIGQIKELRGGGSASFSDGWFETSGRLQDRFRPLTLKNKHTVEYFETIYNRLHEIDGQHGFNYPRISQHFAELALSVIDADDDQCSKQFYEAANDFVSSARNYTPNIQGVALFRRAA